MKLVSTNSATYGTGTNSGGGASIIVTASASEVATLKAVGMAYEGARYDVDGFDRWDGVSIPARLTVNHGVPMDGGPNPAYDMAKSLL